MYPEGPLRDREEILLSFQLTSNKTKNDLEFEWLLCLASTLQSFRGLQVRGQPEAVMAIHPIPDIAKHYSNVERLLFLASELQASQLRRAREVREALRPKLSARRKPKIAWLRVICPPFFVRP
jgi:hypothetical protein